MCVIRTRQDHSRIGPERDIRRRSWERQSTFTDREIVSDLPRNCVVSKCCACHVRQICERWNDFRSWMNTVVVRE